MARGETVRDGWRSAEVRDALDLCLSCEACSTDCPVGVDMATYKAEFLHHHYKGRLRPRSHYSLGWLPLTSVLAGYAARPVNALLRGPLGRRLAGLGGITTERAVPGFASRRELRSALRAVPATEEPAAVLFVDSFARAFRPRLVPATARVLADAGIPSVARDGRATRRGRSDHGATVARLDSGPGRALPVVVAEPSCAAALKRDAPGRGRSAGPCCGEGASASCPSPAPRRWGGCCWRSAPAPSSAPRWSWAATPRSSSSTTPTSVPPWTVR
jgi:Fe-S oxidoreductase